MNQEKLNQRFREQVLNGSLIIAENLFAQGANPDYVYPDGKTLLGILAEKDNLAKIKFLIETCNADPRVKDKDGKTAYDSAVSDPVKDYIDQKTNERDNLNFDFVQDVISCKFREAREKLKKGANPNEGYGDSGLDFVLLDACDNGVLPAIRFLVEEARANPNIVTKGGKTILETVREFATCDAATNHERRVLKCLEDAIWRKEHPFLARFQRKPTGDELIIVAPSTEPVVHSGHTHVGTVVIGPTPVIPVVAPPKRILSPVLGGIGAVVTGIAVVAALFLTSGPEPRFTQNTTEPAKTSVPASTSDAPAQGAEKKDSPAPVPAQATKPNVPEPKPAVVAPEPKTVAKPAPAKPAPVVDHDSAKVRRQMDQRLNRQAQERAALDACRKSNRPVCVVPK